MNTCFRKDKWIFLKNFEINDNKTWQYLQWI